jgi:hypothetical protein
MGMRLASPEGMADEKKDRRVDAEDRDDGATSVAESMRNTGIQSGETGGPDADTPDAPDFSFVSGSTAATKVNETDRD